MIIYYILGTYERDVCFSEQIDNATNSRKNGKCAFFMIKFAYFLMNF